MRLRWVVLLLLIVASCAIAACYEWAAPSELPDARYREWWDEVVACAGNKNGVALEGIAWALHAEPEEVSEGRLRVGEWTPPNKVWIARGWEDEAYVVKHEMLHYLLQRGGHPVPPFGLCTEGVPGFSVEAR
jgi:hypothetical protein